MATHTEWGVRHLQGIATYRSEAAARDALESLHMRSWQRSNARFRESTRPVIVRREVTDWENAE